MKKEAYGKTVSKRVHVYNQFKGVDYAHAPANISTQRCVDGMNMVRSEVGKVTKRTGFEYDGRVWDGKIKRNKEKHRKAVLFFVLFLHLQRLRSCQKATALAAATLRESTVWDMGMRTV